MLSLPKINNKPISYGPRAKDVICAYNCWATQRKRCSNPKSKDFKRYGARGIKVEYESYEFVAWYLREFKLKKYKWATVGRVDHDKNYSFSNIKMEEMRENVLEKAHRVPQGIKLRVYKNGVEFCSFKSIRDAEIILGVNNRKISELENSGGKTFKHHYSFQYVKEGRNVVKGEGDAETASTSEHVVGEGSTTDH